MNPNTLSTAALLAIAVALFLQAMMWDPPAKEVHFRAIMKFCQELPAIRVQGPEAYFRCVAELAPK